MFTFIQSFFFNKYKSITPLQHIVVVVVSYNKLIILHQLINSIKF